MSLLSIVQEACLAIGFSSPSAVVSNTADQIAQQAWRLAKLSGKSLYRRYPWQGLQKEHTFALVAGTQSYALPSDFGYLLGDTIHNRGERKPGVFPITAQEWQALRAWGTTATLWQRGRIRDDQIEFYDSITSAQAGQTIALEYISKHWCESSLGAGQTTFAADTDVARLDEHLILLDVIARLQSAKGLDFRAADMEFQRHLRATMAQDGAKRILSLNARNEIFSPLGNGNMNLPDTGYGL